MDAWTIVAILVAVALIVFVAYPMVTGNGGGLLNNAAAGAGIGNTAGGPMGPTNLTGDLSSGGQAGANALSTAESEAQNALSQVIASVEGAFQSVGATSQGGPNGAQSTSIQVPPNSATGINGRTVNSAWAKIGAISPPASFVLARQSEVSTAYSNVQGQAVYPQQTMAQSPKSGLGGPVSVVTKFASPPQSGN
jgi:hypothetical protein